MLTLRYGNRPIELQKGKPAVEIGENEKLLSTLSLVKEAVGDGELDKVLMAANAERTPKKKIGK